jgi:anti-anti-sigma factor
MNLPAAEPPPRSERAGSWVLNPTANKKEEIMESNLSISKATIGRFTVFTIQGSLGDHNYKELQHRIRASAFSSHVVLDMSRVDRLSSTGLGAVITLIECAQEAKRPLYILNPSQIVKIVFDSSGFPELFNVITSMDEIL